MPEVKMGTIVRWQKLSPILATFCLAPENGNRFPEYEAGQYMALRRERCRLTRPVVGADGRRRYVADVDASGNPRVGPVTHSYSVASAPCQSRRQGCLEFYIVLERDAEGTPGRLTGSLFEHDAPARAELGYVNRITGNFTLAKRAAGFEHVLLVGTGTGVAPFLSMIRQLHFEASRGQGATGVRYTLIHANRTYQELAHHEELAAIEAGRRFDFVYIPSVSRPTARDFDDPGLGRGRANNLLRLIFDMPLKEEQVLQEVSARGEDPARARAALDRATVPALPRHLARRELEQRLDPSRTVILTCGNPSLMADIGHIAGLHRIHFEKEDW